MKKLILCAGLFAGLVLTGCGAEPEPLPEPEPVEPVLELETLEEKASYIIGYDRTAELASRGINVDTEAYLEGAEQYLSGEDSPFSAQEVQQIFTDYQAQLQVEAQAEYDALAAENAAKSEAFLAENATKEGVVTAESGLQYKVLEAGAGEMPTQDSTVQVHYEGRLVNGEVFDSSLARGAPVEFGLTQVIPGWTEGLQLMKEGAKWELYIPSDLAYGPGGQSIGPNEALIFEVQLLQANYEPEEASASESEAGSE